MRRKIRKIFVTGITLAVLLAGCRGKGNPGFGDSVKFQQYYLQGQQLYLTHCGNCHQENGRGLGRVYPPLDTSDYMDENFEKAICLIRYGLKGEVIVNDVSYVQGMSGNASLTDLEIAQIATFIYNSWSHEKGLIDVKTASLILSRCNDEHP